MPLHSRLQLPLAIRKRSATGTRIDGAVSAPGRRSLDLAGPSTRDLFQKALQRGNVLAAVAAAKELPQLSLLDALELTLLIARKDPRRHQRVAARWLLRFLEEHPDVTIEEAGLAASCLIALTGRTTRRRSRPSGPWPKERPGERELGA